MNTATSSPASAPARVPGVSSRGLTGLALGGLVLLIPTVAGSWLLVLASDRGSRCLMYGRDCSPVSGDVLWALFHVALGAGLLALTWPRAQGKAARCGVVVVQWATQTLLGLLILTGA